MGKGSDPVPMYEAIANTVVWTTVFLLSTSPSRFCRAIAVLKLLFQRRKVELIVSYML